MERNLLLLGLLRAQETYGYQLNEIIDVHLGSIVQLKKPTLYKLLAQMADEGWITFREEQDGNRPTRRVYALTPEGETAFQRLLRQALADYKPTEFRSDVGLAFVDAVPVPEALNLLQERRLAIENLLVTTRNLIEHRDSQQLVIEHRVRHLSSELEWTDEVIARIGGHHVRGDH